LWSERRVPDGKTSDGGVVTRTMARVRLAGKSTTPSTLTPRPGDHLAFVRIPAHSDTISDGG
jgi:hypothetical protein